jgi:hypothetical protein
MATVSKALVRGAFPTTIDYLYTTPTEQTTAVVTNIVVANTTATPQIFSLLLDGEEIFNSTPIAGNGTISVDMKQVITGDVAGFASSNTVKVHISGVEIV